MKTIKILVLVLISMLVVVATGNCQNKNGKIEDFVERYSNKTLDKSFKKNGLSMYPHETFYIKISSLVIKSINSREVGDVTLHFVKARAIYNYNPKIAGVVKKEKFYRWMNLVIEEDGFGKMLTDPIKSKEVITISFDGVLMPGAYDNGEDFIR